jgi:hypothetical protein
MQLSPRDILLILDALLMASKRPETAPETMLEFLNLRARMKAQAEDEQKKDPT